MIDEAFLYLTLERLLQNHEGYYFQLLLKSFINSFAMFRTLRNFFLNLRVSFSLAFVSSIAQFLPFVLLFVFYSLFSGAAISQIHRLH
mmetsp:Transcript_36988/g.54313  ORF Transcript_36988/g.54313 Transcript_36988/m.54313 type:complete len:88 (-) Transcript_36988:877-1140(-)